MCIPLGPRRSYRKTSSVSSTSKTKISKSAVEEAVHSGIDECVYRMGGDEEFQEYDGCLNNLLLILQDEATKVKVAGVRSPYYKDGYRTIIMDAPCFHAVILLRNENE